MSSKDFDSSNLGPCGSKTTPVRLPSVAGTRRHSGQEPGPLRCFLRALGRKKPLDGRTDTSLNRCLNLLDLTTLGVGSTLGLGLYVLTGQVASNKAGPAVVISFGLAALASAFSALCYAEFAGRVPRAGSAYAYSYITVGEFVAFIIGWNLILEYVIGASSVARGFSDYLRFVFEKIFQTFQGPETATGVYSNLQQSAVSPTPFSTITTWDQPAPKPTGNLSEFMSHTNSTSTSNNNQTGAGLHFLTMATAAASSQTTSAGLGAANLQGNFLDSTIEYLIKYFDWPSIAIVVAITAFILFGVKESTNVTLLFTAVNMLVVITVIISSISSLKLHNWQLTKEELPPGGNFGEGGFMPYGWSGVLAGSATCFFGFIGFDTIASSAEEARNPKRNVPLSITLSLFISFIAYMSIAIVQTLLWPYHSQDKTTILPYIFAQLNMPVTYWIVLLGAVAGLASSQLGGMYPLPRILYSMAQDKLIYSQLAHVNRRLKLPVRAAIVGAIFIALLACMLDIQDLADMVSIGTLAAYSLVSVSVLIVRYELRDDAVDDSSLLTSRLSFTDILALSETTATTSFAPQDKKSIEANGQQGSNSCKTTPVIERASHNGRNKKHSKLLDLLITWNSADDPDKYLPTEVTSGHSKILISLIVVLTIMLDIVALGLTSSSSNAPVSPESAPTTHLGANLAPNTPDQSTLFRLVTEQPYVNLRMILLASGCIVLVALIAVVLMLSRLPVSKPTHPDMFLVPLVPVIPTISILVNTFLMLNLSYLTWVRFSVWMAIGFFIYFTYGIWNSEGYLLRIHSNNDQNHNGISNNNK